MAHHTSAERDRLRTLTERLGLSVSDEGIDAALDTADELGSAVPESATVERRESVGSMADDPNNALLEAYDEPRVETDEGPLSDVSVAVKDVIAVKNLSMTCGSKSFSVVPSYDATVVERLLDAGASLVGKANTDAFAFGPTGEFSEFGTVTNPVASDRVPGGSSSGSAAAVSAGTVDAALGTDTGGSVRIPAACCGVVGVKPTHRSMSRYGFVDLSPTTDCIGPLARDVETAARVLDAIRGPDVRDPSSSHVSGESATDALDKDGDLTFALLSPFVERSSDSVAATVCAVADALDAREDASVTATDLELGEIETAYPLTIATEFAWLLRQRGTIRGQGTQYTEEWRETFESFTNCLNEHIALRVLPAAYLDERTNGRSYVAAREAVTEFRRELHGLFAEFDLLLAPTLRVLPPKYGEITATEGMKNISGNTGPFSLTGNPVISVPAGESNGLPVGMQVIGPHFNDARAVRGATLIESVRDC
ncbi:aspartyl-tRNA(Asn)/glutamyl-tRNA(Gln) amidotransferase subunit A [Haladaptatus litoreus]|uniref:Aspartyl-tRNA(Asn)/glutamyl-tRNA(Gln) amidotransferase subunit A n=1 Tax=Haladaptatus litoreus TaxID=553468 RepID=A0A1N7F0R6_9EURY|nr:amidase [Haladaptatus litoreus]SIR93973.1 aspartyl-tRNA(Asn)/glutamyl-tRNA(Gln) amidotransferase subunit A [Haladaptatus litoreus]